MGLGVMASGILRASALRAFVMSRLLTTDLLGRVLLSRSLAMAGRSAGGRRQLLGRRAPRVKREYQGPRRIRAAIVSATTGRLLPSDVS